MSELRVGIIGGMGPAATVDLQQRIINATAAEDDADHLHVLIDNNAKVPSRIKALLEGTGESPAPTLNAMAQGLVASGAELLAMPCNTAHHYFDEVAAGLDVPFLNIIEVAANHFSQLHPQPTRVGLLASTAVQRIELYTPCFAQHGMDIVFPSDELQEQVMDTIRAVKSGVQSEAQCQQLASAAADLVGQGANVLLIACTELSALGAQLDSSIGVYDAAQLLAEEIVRKAKAT